MREFNYKKIYSIEETYKDGKALLGYGYSEAIVGTEHKATGITKAKIPKSSELVAYIHTHGGFSPGYYEDKFSPQDYSFMNSTGLPLYLTNITRNVRILTFQNGNEGDFNSGDLVKSGISIN